MSQGPLESFLVPAQPGRLESSQDGTLRVWAPAKINLNLLVGPKRPDGYHRLDSIVARITLYDEILVRRREDGRISFRCRGADCGADQDNLALRAARLLGERFGAGGADISLIKHIPPGRGLGGGSSDAAAVLLAINELWDLGAGAEELCSLAGRLGSDVPLFVGPPAARMTGRGEVLQAIPVHPFAAVLVLPDFACSTGQVYRAFDAAPPPDGTQLDAALLREKPSRWRGLLENQLAPAAAKVAPRLGEMLDRLGNCLPQGVCLTGSGSAMFALCDDPAEAATVLARVPADVRSSCLVVRNNPW